MAPSEHTIGLIDPGSKALSEPMPNLGLAYIAAALEQAGFEVVVLDYRVASEDERKQFFNRRFAWVGLTVTSFSLKAALSLAHTVKQRHPDTKITMGGPHVTIAQKSVLRESVVDYAAYGEGEHTVVDLARALTETMSPSADKLARVEGLIFRDGGSIIVTPPRPRIRNLDSLARPAYHLFPTTQYKVFPLITSRGCPFDCVFCAASAIWGRTTIHRTPENILSEIRHCVKHWGNKPFVICDDTFNVNIESAKDFCRKLMDSGLHISWAAWSFRADNAEPELLQLMKASGCWSVSVGVESADPQVLRNIRKKETIEQIANGIDNLRAAGLTVVGLFMIGNPGDTLDTVKHSIAFARKMRLDDSRFFLALPYPGTDLWNYVVAQGAFIHRDYTNFHHFARQPVFETQEFSARDRIQALQLAERFSLRNKLRQAILHRLRRRILEGEYRDPRVLWQDLSKFANTLGDFVLRRSTKV